MSDEVVTHPKYGRGKVVATRNKQFEYFVLFEDRPPPKWVRRDELVSSLKEMVSEAQQPFPLLDDSCFKSRRMIESLRLGIVPEDCLADFIFGRDQEIQEVVHFLNDPNESTLLIQGEYGTGKSHLLSYVRREALQQGFATASTDMDPNETPFNKPKRVYGRLIRGFCYRSRQDGKLKGFRDFLEEVLAQEDFREHRYFRYMARRRSDEKVWDWIEGREANSRPSSYDGGSYWNLLPMYDYGTAANIYCYLLSGLSWAAREVLGLKGLVLIFDEAETVDRNSYGYQQSQSHNFLRSLIQTATDSELLLETPGHTELAYCRVGDTRYVPFLYRVPSGLRLVFAFTSLDWNYTMECDSWAWDAFENSYKPVNPRWRVRISELDSAPRIDLETISDDALMEAFDHISRFYQDAYHYPLNSRTNEILKKLMNRPGGRTRHFVKGCVEHLDLKRFNNH